MSVPGSTSNTTNRRQKRMGPAPFASFEDLSDELESPEDKNAAGSVVRLPGIREDSTPTPIDHVSPQFVYSGISLVGASLCSSPPNNSIMSSTLSTSHSNSTKLNLQAPNTPRIDISRASSSSHHDSRDSTPERELFEGHDPTSAKLGLGFREEGALDLRSSTEELDFQDQLHEKKKNNKIRPQSPSSSCLHEDSCHQRKDSQSSEIGLLSISGRTSRLSSIGSQGSGHSRLSNASHLSVISGQSGLSRSPSPHKMLLETSFCGTKSPELNTNNAEQTGTKVESEVLEKVLLSRKSDPTEVILAEGLSVDTKPPPEKPSKVSEKCLIKSDITIKVNEPSPTTTNRVTTKMPKKIVSKSGVEYIYIPLKGPLPIDSEAANSITTNVKSKVREVKSATNHQSNPKEKGKIRAKSATSSSIHRKENDEPKYIRIKLKPDYMYDGEESANSNDVKKPISLNLNDTNEIQRDEPIIRSSAKPVLDQGKSLSSTPSASPKLPRHGICKDIGSKTPSPSLSRKSSFASLFRSKETIMSPDSPTSMPGCRRKNTIGGILREASESMRERSRSRSKSRERDKASTLSAAPSSSESIDSKSNKQKSMFSIFKPKKGEKSKSDKNDIDSNLPSIEGIAKVEFKFNDNTSKTKRYQETQLEGDSIRIPLHSPTHYDEDHNMLQDLKIFSSQDSQDTVIEASSRKVEAVIEAIPQETSNTNSSKQELTNRQSSTSSENIVFTTKLGSNNEIFTTKLPKDKQLKKNPSISNQINDNGVQEITTTGFVEEIVNEEILNNTVVSTSATIVEVKIEKEFSNISNIVDSPNNRNSMMSSTADDDRNYSSESERESESDLPKNNSKKDLDLKLDLDNVEPERKGLVLQDSFEDELPYIPTTLPLERSAAVPIVPVKQRSTFEMKTCPIERPRSTTPINPSCLEEYCEEVMGSFNVESVTKTIEKLKISLPRHDSIDKSIKSPRKTGNWFEFAEKGISTGRRSSQDSDIPPPLPPKGVQKEWINFEEIPERRKPPKRIQTLPSRGNIDVPDSMLQDNVVYNYVNPEECKCECHEITAREREKRNQETGGDVQEDEMPLLDDETTEEDKVGIDTIEKVKLDIALSDRRSVVSDSSVDLSTSVGPPETNGLDLNLRTPFTSDLGLSSNRSSIVSQDEPQSPDSGSPNAFPKVS